MTTFDPAPAAALLAAAMNERRRFDVIPQASRPRTLSEGYDVQDRLASEADKGLGLHDKTAGWKLGLGSKNAMKGAKIDRPAIGRLFKSRLVKDGATVEGPAGAKALIEIEIAFTFGRDIAPMDQVAPLDAVSEAHLVSEIVLSRFVDRTVVGLPSFVGDSVGFHALVIGPKVAASDIGTIARSLKVTMDGKDATALLTGDDAIDPLEMVAYLMAHARDRGITIKKGEVVTTGTLSKPFDAVIPCAIAATSDRGGVSYTLKSM